MNQYQRIFNILTDTQELEEGKKLRAAALVGLGALGGGIVGHKLPRGGPSTTPTHETTPQGAHPYGVHYKTGKPLTRVEHEAGQKAFQQSQELRGQVDKMTDRLNKAHGKNKK